VLRRTTVVLALLSLAAGSAMRPPSATISRAGAITITLPVHLLESSEVRNQLTSGLTTVFTLAVTVTDERSTSRGGARIEARFELWEEKYLVAIIGPAGDVQKLTFASDAALERWWRENALVVSTPHKFGQRVNVAVKLKMLPFSAQEQSDTQRWLSRTLRSSATESAERSPAQSAEILRMIVETSVRRRPLLEYAWSVRAEPETR
jgi:hypothetical protein